MEAASPNRSLLRRVLMPLVLVGILMVLGFQFRTILADTSFFPPDDFVEYWAAGNLNFHGKNPYDGQLLMPLEHEAGGEEDFPIMMWNPPWTLTFVMPFGMMPPRLAQLLWMIMGLILIGGCADRLWWVYDGDPKKRWLAWVLAYSFLPTLFVLRAGQIGPLLLLGATGFLVSMKLGRPIIAAFFCVLIAIKPHLIYLFWVVLALWGMGHHFRMLAAGIVAGGIATLIPILFRPTVIHDYYEAITQRTPEQWRSPTLGAVLRLIFGEGRFGLQFLPNLIGLFWLGLVGKKWLSKPWNWLENFPIVLLISFATASYGAWPYDLVFLMPAIIQIASRLSNQPMNPQRKVAIMAYLLINLTALLLNIFQTGSFSFIWMAPTLTLLYIWTERQTRPQAL